MSPRSIGWTWRAAPFIAVGWSVAFFATGCDRSSHSPPPETPAPTAPAAAWTAVDPSQLTDAQRVQHDAALSARNELFNALVGKLMSVMGSRGPAAAVEVCKSEAPVLAQQVVQSTGVKIGRTSWALRNPNNAPPGWVAPLVADRPAEERVAVSPSGELGVVVPIRLMKTCMTCHGPAEQIDPALRQVLATHYPADRATGFNVGDLRGWFWMQVPPVQP